MGSGACSTPQQVRPSQRVTWKDDWEKRDITYFCDWETEEIKVQGVKKRDAALRDQQAPQLWASFPAGLAYSQ